MLITRKRFYDRFRYASPNKFNLRVFNTKNFFSTLLFLVPTLLFAQEKPEVPSLFQAALIIGFNATQVDGDNFAGFHKVGLNAGGTVFVRFHDRVSTSFELLYSQKGSKTTTSEAEPWRALELKLDYLEVPVLINYHDKKVAIFSVGVSFNRLIRSKILIGQLEQGLSNDQFRINDKNDFNIIGGVTFQFKDHYGLNLRYAYSLTSVGYSDASKFQGGKMYNNVISCRGMYIF